MRFVRYNRGPTSRSDEVVHARTRFSIGSFFMFSNRRPYLTALFCTLMLVSGGIVSQFLTPSTVFSQDDTTRKKSDAPPAMAFPSSSRRYSVSAFASPTRHGCYITDTHTGQTWVATSTGSKHVIRDVCDSLADR